MTPQQLQSLKPGTLLTIDVFEDDFADPTVSMAAVERHGKNFNMAAVRKYISVEDKTNVTFIEMSKIKFTEGDAVVLYLEKFYIVDTDYLTHLSP